MTALIIPFPRNSNEGEAHDVTVSPIAPTGGALSLRKTRLADLGSIRIVGTARTISTQLARLAAIAAGICPSMLP